MNWFEIFLDFVIFLRGLMHRAGWQLSLAFVWTILLFWWRVFRISLCPIILKVARMNLFKISLDFMIFLRGCMQRAGWHISLVFVWTVLLFCWRVLRTSLSPIILKCPLGFCSARGLLSRLLVRGARCKHGWGVAHHHACRQPWRCSKITLPWPAGVNFFIVPDWRVNQSGTIKS